MDFFSLEKKANRGRAGGVFRTRVSERSVGNRLVTLCERCASLDQTLLDTGKCSRFCFFFFNTVRIFVFAFFCKGLVLISLPFTLLYRGPQTLERAARSVLLKGRLFASSRLARRFRHLQTLKPRFFSTALAGNFVFKIN